MNPIDLINEPFYVDDIDTPVFDYLHSSIVTKNFHLEPLNNSHFLDLFEFRLQNEPLECDPFDNIGAKFEEAYTNFFTYTCNVDNLAWVLKDRIYVVGFFLLEVEVNYNEYMKRNAHLSYEISDRFRGPEVHSECIKALSDRLFGESHIPRIQLHLDESDDDKDCMAALEQLGFTRKPIKENGGWFYYLINDDPILKEPPRHMPFILKAYHDEMRKADKRLN